MIMGKKEGVEEAKAELEKSIQDLVSTDSDVLLCTSVHMSVNKLTNMLAYYEYTALKKKGKGIADCLLFLKFLMESYNLHFFSRQHGIEKLEENTI